MKRFAGLILILTMTTLSLMAGKEPVGWETDFARAQKLAEEKNLPVLVLFSGTDWCPPCKALRRTVLDKPEFRQALKDKCVMLYVDVPRGHNKKFERDMQEKYSFIQLRGVPTAVVTDGKISTVKSRPRGRSIQDFVEAVQAVAGGE